MQFQWLLFDADNTLLDFTGASRRSLWCTLEDFGQECDQSIYLEYKRINVRLWHEFEDAKVTAAQLRIQRFELLLEFIRRTDLNPEELSKIYLENLVLESEAYEGVEALLQELKKRYTLSVVTNGLKDVQRPRLNRLQLTDYFASIIVSDEIGHAKPSSTFFEIAYRSIGNPPPKEQVLVIGDNLKSDIQGGKAFGFKTCWLHHGQENTSDIQPDFEIGAILEVAQIL